MFPYLKKLIKAVLTLSHGSADVKRSLAVNKRAIGTNRTLLTSESPNGIRQVKDAVALEDGKIHARDFNKELFHVLDELMKDTGRDWKKERNKKKQRRMRRPRKKKLKRRRG